MLGNADWLASVSCTFGPAFEGAGISSGMRAMRSAIDHVRIDPASCQVSFTTILNEAPRGICGSGIIDAAAAIVSAGILDFNRKTGRDKALGPSRKRWTRVCPGIPEKNRDRP